MKTSITRILLAGLLASTTACTAGDRPGTPSPGDDDPRRVEACVDPTDTDGDGVADAAETTADTDGDGTPNYLDDDSDGDGISDREEHMWLMPCMIADADGDGVPNNLDTDSDNDGIPDADEVGRYNTDPYDPDSDDDGFTDLAETAAATDPRDSTSRIPDTDFFVVLPYFDDEHELRTLRFGTEISVADVYFLIDTTGSMTSSIENVQYSLMRIARQIASRIPDVQMGVGHFEDFPDAVFGENWDGYGGSGRDAAYEHVTDVTADLAAVQSGLDGLVTNVGMDYPESQVEALYQTATGVGGTWSFAHTSAPPHTIPPRACPTVPDEVGRRRGYPCFRPNALPIVVLVSDADWHNGPTGGAAYTNISPAPHHFSQAAAALNSIGARFIGVTVGGGGRMEAEAMARQTGTVDSSAMPLVYDASGGTVSDQIVTGIETLTNVVAQTVTTRTENLPDVNPDMFDATTFIKAITPLEGYAAGGIAGSGYDSKDDVAFYGVIPGTLVEFGIDFYNDVREPGSTAQIFQARILVLGNGVAELDMRNVYIIVPPEGGTVLI
jgi:hypothetical protein